jgi:uncharacterized protein DUF4231
MDGEQPAGTARSFGWNAALVAVALLLVAAIAFGSWQAAKAPRGPAVINAFQKLQIQPEETQTALLGQVILENFTEYRRNTRNWSFVYFGCLFLSAALAALAGVILKLEYLMTNDHIKKDVAALLAMTSALLVTLATTGNFQQKWSANRLAAAKMETLAYDFMTTTDRKADLPRFSARIQDISFERNAEIVSTDRAETKNHAETRSK